jgi:hypothetical protein
MVSLIACAVAFGAAGPAPVAMVSDLQGKGTLVKGAARSPLALLADLDSATQVELEANARMVALYLDGSAEYTFKGPATVAFAGREPQVVKGAQPEKRSVLGGKAKDVQIKSVGMVQGAIVMRGSGARSRIRLINPGGTRTLDSRPEFRWSDDQPGLNYHFELSDETGRTLYESETRSTSLKLPAEVTLKEGVTYTWSVGARSMDGRKYSSVADFSIASADVRKQVEALRPAAAAPISDRVAYAAWLEQAELRDEARKYWRVLASERPADERLQSLARE